MSVPSIAVANHDSNRNDDKNNCKNNNYHGNDHSHRNYTSTVDDRNPASPYTCIFVYLYYTTRNPMVLVYKVYRRSCRTSIINRSNSNIQHGLTWLQPALLARVVSTSSPTPSLDTSLPRAPTARCTLGGWEVPGDPKYPESWHVSQKRRPIGHSFWELQSWKVRLSKYQHNFEVNLTGFGVAAGIGLALTEKRPRLASQHVPILPAMA